jgi:hypothetical protein
VAVAVAAEGPEDSGTGTALEPGSTDNVNMINTLVLLVAHSDIGRWDYMKVAAPRTAAAKVELDIGPAVVLEDWSLGSARIVEGERPIAARLVGEVAEAIEVGQREGVAIGADAPGGSPPGRRCWAVADMEVLAVDRGMAAGVEVGREGPEVNIVSLEHIDSCGVAAAWCWGPAREGPGAGAAAANRGSLPVDSNLLAGSGTLLIWIKQCYSSPVLNSARILLQRKD